MVSQGPIHDAGNDGPNERQSASQPANCGSLTKPPGPRPKAVSGDHKLHNQNGHHGMLYPPGFEQEKIASEQTAIDALIAWLANKSADVWLWFAQNANWDTCTPVLSWMIAQPNCDRAVVATIFWMSDPCHSAEEIANSKDGQFLWDEDNLVHSILLTWRKKRPNDSSMRPFTLGRDSDYLQLVNTQLGGNDPLSVPGWLFGPFGERSFDQKSMKIHQTDKHLRSTLEILGISIGPSTPYEPGSIKEMLALETPRQARERRIIGLTFLIPIILFLIWIIFF